MARRTEQREADEALVRAAIGGDARAFETLLQRHEARVLRVLRLMGVGWQDREDVAQEVFVRVFKSLNGYHAGRRFESWIYKISVNAAYDYRSRLGRRAGEIPLEESRERRDEAGGPQEASERRELRRRLEGALEELTPRERAVFVLRELEGLESGVVARVLGIASITVRRHLGQARRRLRGLLEPGGS